MFALLGALLFVGKLVMAPLPNVEPVSLLIMAYTAVLGWYALFPVAIYGLLEVLVWGLGLWSAGYLYVWPLLVVLSMLVRRWESPWVWAALAGGFGLSFGALFVPLSLLAGGWAAALSWWVSGLPFDLLHGVSNFVLARALFRPCCRLLRALVGRTAISP